MAVITDTPPPAPAPLNIEFFSRIASVPVVNLAFNCASSVYVKAKEGSPFLVQRTLSTAEQTVRLAVDRAMPVVNRLEKPISLVDTFACKTLDRVETRLPIVTKTPEEITATTQSFVNEQLIFPAAKTADRILDNALGQLALGMLSYAITTTDNIVDQYLPNKTKVAEDAASETVADALAGDRPSQQVSYSVRRAASVASKVQKRVTERAGLVLNDVGVLGHAYAEMLSSLIEWGRLHSADAQSIGLASKLRDLGTEFRQQLATKQPVSDSIKLVFGLTERLAHVLSFATETVGRIPNETAAGIRDRVESGLNFITDTGAQLAKSTKVDEAALTTLVVLQQRLPSIYSTLVDASALAVGFSKLAFPNWHFRVEDIASEVDRRTGSTLATEETSTTETKNEEEPQPPVTVKEPQPAAKPVESSEKQEPIEETESPPSESDTASI